MQELSQSPRNGLGRLLEDGWLAQQPPSFQHAMARAGRWITLSKGQVLYGVGDPGDAIFGLEEGLLDVAIPISEDELVTLHRATPGFWIGDSALLAGTSRGVAVLAAADCRVFRLNAGAVRRHLEENPQDWALFFKLSHMNVMQSLAAFAEVVVLPPRARFARVLLRIADSNGIVRATQEDLGSMVGMSRASFRRAMASLIEAGIVETEYGGLRILDRDALEKEA